MPDRPVLPATPSFSRRLAALLAGELINKGSVVVAFVWLARTLEPARYGEVEWALSILMVALLASDAGLTTWAAARVAAAPDEVPELVARVGGLRLALAVPAYVVLSLVAWSYGGTAGPALAVYGLVLFLSPLFLQYLFNGLFQPRWAALGNALRGVTFAAVVILFVNAESSPSAVAVAEVFGAVALALCSLIVMRRSFDLKVRLRDGRVCLGALLARSWPTGASEVTWGVHWYASLILLGYLASSTDAAWHSASLRLLMALHTFVWLYLYVMLPGLARLVTQDPDGWARLVERSVRLTSWVGLGIALVGTLGARPILTVVFGDQYVEAVPVLRAMVWIIPVAWLSGHVRYSFIAAQRPEKDYHAALFGMVTTVSLALLLVPALRGLGAGIALLGGMLVNGVAASWLARGVLPQHALVRNVTASSACLVVSLSVGIALSPIVGDLAATAIAGALMLTCALVAEREFVAGVIQNGTAILRPGVESRVKART